MKIVVGQEVFINLECELTHDSSSYGIVKEISLNKRTNRYCYRIIGNKFNGWVSEESVEEVKEDV